MPRSAAKDKPRMRRLVPAVNCYGQHATHDMADIGCDFIVLLTCQLLPLQTSL